MPGNEDQVQSWKDWDDVSPILTVSRIREHPEFFPFSRSQVYILAHLCGKRIGRDFFLTRDSVRAWVEKTNDPDL